MGRISVGVGEIEFYDSTLAKVTVVRSILGSLFLNSRRDHTNSKLAAGTLLPNM